MVFDYLNGLFINVPLIIMGDLPVTRCQNMVSHSHGFLFHLKCVICDTKIKVNVALIFAAYSNKQKIFATHTPPLTCFVCGYVSFLMYLSFPFLLKQDVISIKKGQLSMYRRRIFMYPPRIKNLLVCLRRHCVLIALQGILAPS